MRRVISLCLALMLAVLSVGCAENPGGENQWEVTLTAENVTSLGMTLVCECWTKSDWEISTGSYYEISVLRDGDWISYERPDGNGFIARESIAYIVSMNSPFTWELDWTWLYGELPVGQYRLTKTFAATHPNGRDDGFEELQVFAEFVIP